MQHADVVIAGAGITGLSVGLELRRAGRTIIVLERSRPGDGASRAAAGMLAVHDRSNPPELLPLAERSEKLYPDYLARLADAGGAPVPFETEWALEQEDDLPVPGDVPKPSETRLLRLRNHAVANMRLHREWSLDPRRLFASLLNAVTRSGIVTQADSNVRTAAAADGGAQITLEDGRTLTCGDFVDCTGAWSAPHAHPVKGQMLRVQLPSGALHLEGKGNVVVRTPSVYLVPRLDGSCLVGATVEHAGFDTAVHPQAIQALRERASELLPAVATAPELESWSGLRPGTVNGLPVLGAVAEHMFVANGLYRNGILLAPVVAETLASLVGSGRPAIDLAAFAPAPGISG